MVSLKLQRKGKEKLAENDHDFARKRKRMIAQILGLQRF